MIDVDDISQYDDFPAAVTPKAPVAAAPATMPVMMLGMVTEPLAEVVTEQGTTSPEHRVVDEHQTERSMLFLADPVKFFVGWRRVPSAWVAPWYPESRN